MCFERGLGQTSPAFPGLIEGGSRGCRWWMEEGVLGRSPGPRGESGGKGSDQIPGCLRHHDTLPGGYASPGVTVCAAARKPSAAERLGTGEESAGRGLPEAVGLGILTILVSGSVLSELPSAGRREPAAATRPPPPASGAFWRLPPSARPPAPPLAPALRRFHLRRFCSCGRAFVFHRARVFVRSQFRLPGKLPRPSESPCGLLCRDHSDHSEWVRRRNTQWA